MTIWILAVVILAFVGTVCVWVGLDALSGEMHRLPPMDEADHAIVRAAQERYAVAAEEARRRQRDSLERYVDTLRWTDAERAERGHLSADASQRIHRQVRGIH